MKDIRLFNARGGQEDLSNLFGDKTMGFRLAIEKGEMIKYLEITKLWIPFKDKSAISLSVNTDNVVGIKIEDGFNDRYLIIEE